MRTLSFHACCLSCLLLLVALAGCNKSKDVTKSDEPPEEPQTAEPEQLTAQQIVDRMVKAYAEADSYYDNGVLTVSFLQNGQQHEDSDALAVRFARPNKFSARVHSTHLESDGDEFRVRRVRNYPDQVVVVPAPERVTHSLVAAHVGHPPTQLFLLTGDPTIVEHQPAEESSDEQSVTPLLGAANKRRLLDDANLGDSTCYRVEIQSDAGTFTLWIDQQSFILRRCEYPPETFVPELARNAALADVKLVADFKNAAFAEVDASEFDQIGTEGLKQLRYFVTAPQPLDPLIGKQTSGLSFDRLDGTKLTQAELQDKIVILVWFTHHVSCASAVKDMSDLHAVLKNNPNVMIRAVWVADPTVSDEQLQRLIKSWGADLPVVRDVNQFGKDVFNIDLVPRFIVLDRRGVVQATDVGTRDDQDSKTELLRLIEQLDGGVDLAAEVRADYQGALDKYEDALAAASVDNNADDAVRVELPQTNILPRSDPKHLRLTKLWETKEVTAPGNFLVYTDAGDKQHVLVHDGWRTLIELSEAGKVLSRRELDLPENAGVSYVRTRTDAKGQRYFAATSIGGQQLHVFDGNWKLLTSYPSPEQTHPGIIDIQMLDLDRDENRVPEVYVGFGDTVGVQQVSLAGERTNWIRIYDPIISIAATPDDGIIWPKLLVTYGSGILKLDQRLEKAGDMIKIPAGDIHFVFSAQFPANEFASLCALSFQVPKKLVAIGLSDQFDELWSLDLSGEQFDIENQIQFVTSGELLDGGGGQWVIAEPSGAIHIKGDDGKFYDTFNYGDELSGIAVAKLGSQRVLLFSTKDGVAAWQVEQKNGE